MEYVTDIVLVSLMLWIHFISFFSVVIVDFKHVNVCWVVYLWVLNRLGYRLGLENVFDLVNILPHMNGWILKYRSLPLSMYIPTAQKMTFSVKDFFSKCEQIWSFLRICLHLLMKFFTEDTIFCAVGIYELALTILNKWKKLRKKLCFTEFSTKIHWNTRLAASDVFHMFIQSIKFF